MIVVDVIVSRLSMTLSSQFFETSDCTPPDPDYEFRNVSVGSSSSLKNNGRGEGIYLENAGQSHRHNNGQTAIIDNAATTQQNRVIQHQHQLQNIFVITLSVIAVLFRSFHYRVYWAQRGKSHFFIILELHFLVSRFSCFFVIFCSIIQLFPTIPLILYFILDMLFWPVVLHTLI